MSHLLTLALLMAITLQTGQPGQTTPPQDPSLRQGLGEQAAAIRGRVLRADGRPLARARLRLAPLVNTPGGGPQIAESDLEGRYEFTDLVAGQYSLVASKMGFLRLELGQRRPFEPGRPIRLAAGERREDIDIVLPRPSAIVGRIVDENGDPIQGASVRALRMQSTQGRRRLVDAPGASAQLTNDIGGFRIHGLQPGQYIVSAVVGQIVFPGPPVSDLPGYATTYFPGTASAADARLVTVELSQDTRGVDFALSPARTARVSGKAMTSTGEPISGGILLSPSQRSGGTAMPGGARTHLDGSFAFSNVAPGEYVLQAYKGRLNPFTEGEFATQFVTVNGMDVPGIVLRTTPGSSIKGRVTVVGSGTLRPRDIDLVPTPIDLDQSPLNGGSRIRAAIRNDWTFELAGMSGPRRLRLARAPEGWALKGVYVSGSDVTDTALTFGTKDQSITDVEVVLTNNVTELAGAVMDARGQPAIEYAVVVFSADRELWYPQSRYFALARPGIDGTFRVRGLPPGQYHVAALDWVQGDDWQSPPFLQTLSSRATMVTLADGQQLTVMPQLVTR